MRASRIAPEQVEGGVQHLLVFVPMRHRGAHLGAAADIDERERAQRGAGSGGTDRQAGATQQAREVHNVGGEEGHSIAAFTGRGSSCSRGPGPLG